MCTHGLLQRHTRTYHSHGERPQKHCSTHQQRINCELASIKTIVGIMVATTSSIEYKIVIVATLAIGKNFCNTIILARYLKMTHLNVKALMFTFWDET